MSSIDPNPPMDEAGVERVVRSILLPLNRRLEVANLWGCTLFGFVLAPLLLVGLWWIEWTWWLAVPIAVVGPFLLWVVFWVGHDRRAAARAAAIFNQKFPPGHPDRELAVGMLSEMEYPTLAHEKLRDALRTQVR